MKTLQTYSDKAAMSLSLLCALQCLAMPWATVLLPSAVALPLSEEAFHLWMLVAVLPVSAYALTMGCAKHKRFRLMLIGGTGMALLSAAAFLGHDMLSHTWERLLTLIGACVIACGHFFNFRLCQQHDACCGPE